VRHGEAQGQRTVLRACGVAKRHAGNALLLEKARHETRYGFLKDGEVGWLGVQAEMAHPDVSSDEGADDGALHLWAFAGQVAQGYVVKAKKAVAIEPEPLLELESVEALLAPRLGGRGVEQLAAAIAAAHVEVVVLDDAALGIRDVLQTGLAVDHPDLLARRRDLDTDVGGRVANL
jgi:hypothetical protein